MDKHGTTTGASRVVARSLQLRPQPLPPFHTPAVVSAPTLVPVMVPAPVFVPVSTGLPIKVYTVPFQALHATHPSNSIPSRSSVDSATSSPMPGPTHVSWNELPEIVRTRLCVKYDFLKSRIWASWQGFTPFVWTRYTDALGSSTSMTSDGTVKTAMIKTIPDIRGVLKCGDHFCNFYELSNLRKLSCLYSCMRVLIWCHKMCSSIRWMHRSIRH